jgi:uncharacterized protein YcbK (DUF882 family)
MIELKELLSGNKFNDLPMEHKVNILELLKRINIIRDSYGKPMNPTSGYRTLQHHLDIYAAKGITPDKVPMGSQHLKGNAVDIYDPKQELQKWCITNEKELATVGLWVEDFSSTPNWCHFQLVPPKSGKRFFKP